MSLQVRLVVCGILVGAPGLLARGAEPVNLLTNGGFEEGTVGWMPDAKHELVDGRGEAHSGKACLTGEITGDRQALMLRRRVPVKKGNRYDLEVWARATNRTKLVVRAVLPGSDSKTKPNAARKLIAAFENVPAKWRRFTTPVTIAQDGTLELVLVAPSSHGSPPGQIWLDDLALHETEMPPLVNVSAGKGFCDEPAMATAGDGSIYVAWNSFREGADSLQIARYLPENERFKPAGRWQVLGGEGTYVLGVQAVSTGAEVALVYAAEVDKQWDLYTIGCGPGGPTRPVAITSDAAVDVKPDVAFHGDTLWIAWESNGGGSRQILATSVRDGKVAEPAAVSPMGGSCYDPSIEVLAGGEVCVAWHSFREDNYDIYLCRKSAGNEWSAGRRLTKAPSVDRHAELFSRGDELWLAYENAQTGGRDKPYRLGATDRRRLIVAQVTSNGLFAPKSYHKQSPLYGRCEAARAAFDDAGRLWLAYLKPRLPAKNWEVYVTSLSGQRWQKPRPVSSLKGFDRTPALAVGEEGVLVAFQADPTPGSFATIEQSAASTSDIYLARVKPDLSGRTGPIALEPLVEPDEPFEAGPLRAVRGEDLATPSIDYQGQELNLYFGDLHEHTEISICNRNGDQSVDESYQHMRDIARHDFACTTDHGYNFNPYFWGYTSKLVRTNDDPNRFLTFLAEEWTSTFEEYSEKHPYGFYGHRNLIFADPYFPRWFTARNRQTPAQLWEDLRKMNANFVHVPHQLADTGNVPTDWDFADEEAQPVAEIFQIRGSYEYKGTPREAGRTVPGPGSFLQDAWARGIVIGVIASPDHGGGYGKACVYAPELTREAVLDAIRARHCYGTTAAKIFLDVRVNGHLMGEKVASLPDDRVEVQIRVRCPAEIDRVEVCRNNKFIYTRSPEGKTADLTFVDREPLDQRSYYYVRVIQKDEEIAWASPVWFGAK